MHEAVEKNGSITLYIPYIQVLYSKEFSFLGKNRD